MTTVLLLGGTAEAVAVARDIASTPGIEVIYSLAGRTRTPNLPDCTVRQGGFGGVDGLARYVAENGIAAIIDATHPYARQMAAHARAVSADTGTMLFKFLRPPWEEPADAPWLHAATPANAARLVDGRFSRVFLSSGLNDIPDFSHLTDIWFLVRSVDRPDTPVDLAQHHHITGRGPFDPEAETALLRDWRIDALVSKNSGGAATAAKLDAARALDVPVVMIDRPPVPPGDLYTDVAPLVDSVRRFCR